MNHYYSEPRPKIYMVPNSIRGAYQRRYKKLRNEAEDCDCPKEVEAFLKDQKNHE